MLNLETGWVNERPAVRRASEPTRTGSTTLRSIYPSPGAHRDLGHRGRGHRQPRRPARRSRPNCTTRRASTAPAGGGAAPRDAADDVAGDLLLADPGDRRRDPVLPRAAGDQQRTGEPGGTTLFFNLYLYKTFFTYQNMAYGATLAWLLFLVTLASRCSCSGPRAAGSTTRASARMGAEAALQDAARTRVPWVRRRGRRRPRDATPVVRVDVPRWSRSSRRSCRRSCGPSMVSLKTPEQLSELERADLPALPQTFE